MKLRRVFRDAAVLIAFCGGFYLLTIFVSRLDGSDESNKSDFSNVRLRADEKIERRDWDSAADEYRQLVEADPYNGRASFMLASCYYYQANAIMETIRDLSAAEPVDTGQIAQLEEEVAEIHKETKVLFRKSQEFARHRSSSLVRLAVIECREGDYDNALIHLSEFIEFGGFTQAGLGKYREFGQGGDEMTTPGSVSTASTRLHDRPEFWAVVRKESKNRK